MWIGKHPRSAKVSQDLSMIVEINLPALCFESCLAGFKGNYVGFIPGLITNTDQHDRVVNQNKLAFWLFDKHYKSRIDQTRLTTGHFNGSNSTLVISQKCNLYVVETHVSYRPCLNRHLKRILYERMKKPLPGLQ